MLTTIINAAALSLAELYKMIARCWEGPHVDMWPTVARPGWEHLPRATQKEAQK